MSVGILIHHDGIEPVKAPKKRESDDLSGIGFIDGYEFVTNIINDHVIPYVSMIPDSNSCRSLWRIFRM